MATCYDANFNEISCDLPDAVYDASFTKLSAAKTIAPGSIQYDADGNGFILTNGANGVERVPTGTTKSGTTAYQQGQLDLTKRGQDLSAASSAASAGASIYGTNVAAATSANNLAENQRQFDVSDQFAKDKWLVEQQNAIATLTLQQQTLATTQAQNARQYQIELQNQQFLQNKFKFDSAITIGQEARATQAQLFGQQATVANLQLNMAQITQQANDTNAQLKNATELFNAGKSADVSMFNIDEQTKVAQFNSSMAFDVQKANVENERLRQQQLIDVAKSISDAAADPGDRGKLAALIQAYGGDGFGAMDAPLAQNDLRTNDSLTPLEAMLRQRSDIQNSNPDPFSFTPITAGTASFTPATAAQTSQPNFSGVNIPQPNTTPFQAPAMPDAKTVSPQTFDSTKQGFIATGNTTAANNQQFINTGTGQPLTAEERAQIPDIALQGMIDSGVIAHMAQGGMTGGAYVGDEQGAELHVPLPGGGRLVIPHNMLGGAGGAAGGIMSGNGSTGGVTPGFGDAPQQGQQPWFSGRPASMDPNQTPQMAGNPADRFRALLSGLGGFDPSAFAGGMDGLQPKLQAMSAQTPHMAKGGVVPPDGEVVDGPYMGSTDGADIHIPIPGTNMTIIMPKPKGKGAKKMPKHASGGLFDQTGQTMYEGLGIDQNRQMAQDFLNQAGNRAAAGTGFDINHLPTPVGASAPGTNPYLTNLLASLNALRRGIPQGFFTQQAALLRPTAMSEGVIGRV